MVPVTTFAKVTGGAMTQKMCRQQLAAQRLSAPIWCSQAWTSCPCSAFPSGNGAEKGDESLGMWCQEVMR